MTGGAALSDVVHRRLLVTVQVSLLAVTLTVQFVLAGPVLFERLPITSPRWIESGVYAALAVIGGVAVLRLRRSLSSRLRWFVIAALLASSVTLSASLPLDARVRFGHWSFGLIGWYAVTVLLDDSAVPAVAFLGLHVTILASPVLIHGATMDDLASMTVTAVSVSGFQAGVAWTTVLTRRIADTAASIISRDEELVVSEAVAAAKMHRYQERYAQLQKTTVPVIAGLATGELDPSSPVVRHRCAVESARMRRLLVDDDAGQGLLIHGLTAVIDTVERHGATVELVTSGRPIPLPADVREALLAPIIEVLVDVRERARVSVFWSDHGVRIAIVCPVSPHLQELPRSDLVSCSRVGHGGELFVEVSWQSR